MHVRGLVDLHSIYISYPTFYAEFEVTAFINIVTRNKAFLGSVLLFIRALKKEKIGGKKEKKVPSKDSVVLKVSKMSLV